MPTRVPEAKDFPASLVLTIISPPSTHPPTNALLLLHGLGDSEAPFASLARQLALPETASVSIRAPSSLPLGLEGFHWADDLTFDAGSGIIDQDAPVEVAALNLLRTVIDCVLVGRCGFRTRDIQILGFGQGGTVALEGAVKLWRTAERGAAQRELGGIVSIGGALSSKAPPMLEPKCPTPVLLCKGTKDSAVSEADKERVKACFTPTDVVEWPKTGDGMPTNRDEMLPLMRFWARRLKSRRGVPEGSIEIS